MSFVTMMEGHLAWGDKPLLDNADLAVEPGQRIGLIGRNGTGKSSLLKVLAGIEKLDGQLGIEAAHALSRHGQLAVGLPAARNINSSHHKRLVHGDRRVGKARNARLVAQRLAKRLAQHNARVLDGMMRIDLHVAHRVHRQIEQAMAAKSVEHVVEKRHAGRDIAHARSVQVELYDNVGLARLAGYLGIAVHLHLLLHQRGKRSQHLVVFLRGTHGNA